MSSKSKEHLSAKSTYAVVSLTQRWIISIGVLAHIIFIPTIRNYLTGHRWGAPSLAWEIPNRLIDVHGYTIHAYSLITGHVISSYCLLLGLLLQFSMMLFFKHSKQLIIVHRIMGALTTFIFLPMFCFFAFCSSFWVIITPFNKILFAVLPCMITYGMLKGVVDIINGRKIKHADGMYLALICLNAAPFFRLVMALGAFLHYPTISTNGYHEPDDYGALVRTLLLIVALLVSYWSVGRLRCNRYPILALIFVLAAALMFTPWQFFGTPLP